MVHGSSGYCDKVKNISTLFSPHSLAITLESHCAIRAGVRGLNVSFEDSLHNILVWVTVTIVEAGGDYGVLRLHCVEPEIAS